MKEDFKKNYISLCESCYPLIWSTTCGDIRKIRKIIRLCKCHPITTFEDVTSLLKLIVENNWSLTGCVTKNEIQF